MILYDSLIDSHRIDKEGRRTRHIIMIDIKMIDARRRRQTQHQPRRRRHIMVANIDTIEDEIILAHK